MEIELRPIGLLRRAVEVHVDGRLRCTVERTSWRTSTRFELDGQTFRTSSQGWFRRRWKLLRGASERASATPAGVLGTSYQVDLKQESGASRSATLESAGLVGRQRVLKARSKVLGRLRPTGMLTAGKRIEVQGQLPLEQWIFVGLLAIHQTERRRRSGG